MLCAAICWRLSQKLKDQKDRFTYYRKSEYLFARTTSMKEAEGMQLLEHSSKQRSPPDQTRHSAHGVPISLPEADYDTTCELTNSSLSGSLKID